jgi:hypothetical protein
MRDHRGSLPKVSASEGFNDMSQKFHRKDVASSGGFGVVV